MKVYIQPEIDITFFTAEDILVASGTGTGIDGSADYDDLYGEE